MAIPGSPTPLRVSVVNGNITYVAHPLLIGHYRSSRLSGAEAVIDRATGWMMSESLAHGRYPAQPGTQQVFVNASVAPDNPWQLPRPSAVIVAGLGFEGELRGTDLVETVAQAVIAWSQRLTERPPAPRRIVMATTLMGSGGWGVNPGQSAQLIVQGVCAANLQLKKARTGQRAWPIVERLHIVELYLDRASDAWRALRVPIGRTPTSYSLDPFIRTEIGAMRRPPEPSYRGASYDFVSALIQRGDDGDERIIYSIDTTRARSEVRSQSAQLPLITTLLRSVSEESRADADIGRTLLRLLVPVDLEVFMASSQATVLQVDRGTSAIPWELLDNRTADRAEMEPWAIRTQLLRKLRTSVPASPVKYASAEDGVLVIGDPACDRTKYPKLRGARREAHAVAQACARFAKGGRGANRRRDEPTVPPVTAVISARDLSGADPDVRTVMNALMAGPWRMIHIAGHGDPPTTVGTRVDPRGVVLSDNAFFGPKEIAALRVKPELVFINCCFLGRADGASALRSTDYDRATFASGVAESLIAVGVKCVVATGWAVEDGAAEAFAKAFYSALLSGASFIQAVGAARRAAYAKGGNTWAAYQCYGDPDWVYRPATGDPQAAAAVSPAAEFESIASVAALEIALERIQVGSEYPGAAREAQRKRLRYLADATSELWKDNGALLEGFGAAWAALGDYEVAIGWYEQARTALDGTAAFAALEQLANLHIRVAAQAALRRRSARTSARARIADAIALLGTLRDIGSTIERESLFGSAYKRLAMIEAADGRADEEREAIVRAERHYAAAERLAGRHIRQNPDRSVNLFHPAMNRLVASIALGAHGPGDGAVDARVFKRIRRSMSSASPDFWTVVGQSELDLFEAILRGRLADRLPGLLKAFSQHHARVDAIRWWASVYDNAVFVLAGYRRRASPKEGGAATKLLEVLAAFADGSARATSGRRSSPRVRDGLR